MIKTLELKLETSGDGDIQDITVDTNSALKTSGLIEGTATLFVPGSTAALTTIEYEPGLLKDLPKLMQKLIPAGVEYEHDNTWHDGNGFSHLRAALIGPDITVPFAGGKLILGTWQQIVFLEFDNRPRSRTVVIQLNGE